MRKEELSYVEIANHNLFYRIVKRIFDVGLSLIGFIALFPLMLIISLAIIIDDGFPAIFVQDRNGQNGRVFSMYKFRTMCKNAPEIHKELLINNEMNGPAFKMKNDPRVTRVGKILRRTSLDELPQLINIIKGDMSIVGPRPLLIEYLPVYTEREKKRHLVRGGLTGLAQVNGRNFVPWPERLEMDVQYVENVSFILDCKIIKKTIGSIIKRNDIAIDPEKVEGDFVELRNSGQL